MSFTAASKSIRIQIMKVLLKVSELSCADIIIAFFLIYHILLNREQTLKKKSLTKHQHNTKLYSLTWLLSNISYSSGSNTH